MEDSSGGRYTCRQAGPGACAGGPAARSASLAHRTSSRVTSCRAHHGLRDAPRTAPRHAQRASTHEHERSTSCSYYDVRMRAGPGRRCSRSMSSLLGASHENAKRNHNVKFGNTDNIRLAVAPTHAPASPLSPASASSMAMPARPPSPMPIAKTAVCTPTLLSCLLYPNDHATLAHIAASTAARLLCAEVRLDETIRLPYGAGGRTRSFAAKHA